MKSARLGRRRLARFQLVGLMGAALQLGTLFLLTSRLGVESVIATAIAVEVAVVHNFAWHERWTWADRMGARETLGNRLKRFCQFNASTGFFSIGLNVPLTYPGANVLGLPYLVANLLAIGVAALFNFGVSDLVVFRGDGADSHRNFRP